MTMNIQSIEKAESVAYIEGMAKQEYTAVYKKDGKWIIAWIKEVPGALTQARTMKEANRNLREVLPMILDVNRELGIVPAADTRKKKILIKTRD